jgi:hypothetical protein
MMGGRRLFSALTRDRRPLVRHLVDQAAKSEVDDVGPRHLEAAHRDADLLRDRTPGSAAHDAPVHLVDEDFRIDRCLVRLAQRIGLGVEPVGHPFPNVADHIDEAETVLGERPDRRRAAVPPLRVVLVVRLPRIGILLRIDHAVDPPRRVLPLRSVGRRRDHAQ